MVEHTKRKKHHDKDKYYHLAKEQGFRSRAAFKLTQINRKFPCLEKAHTAILDLCAAPGGWTQVAARTCPKSVQIVAVDILPIRAIAPHVQTLIGDITTDKCKADIRNALQKVQVGNKGTSGRVDLVLHDGAPNIGADYAKDAYQQNELVLHALRCATQHLRSQGTFITKVYRSADYARLLWLMEQFFDRVTAFKPKASRAASSEIFWVAAGYKAPSKIDPRLLDPKHVFEAVSGETTGGTLSSSAASLNVLHKLWDQKASHRRNRGGYDTDRLDATMRHIEPVTNFIHCKTFKDAVQLLSTSTGLAFSCATCQPISHKAVEDDDEDEIDGASSAKTKCSCEFLLHHPLTTPEIKESIHDLQLLSRSDFKSLLTWRTKMQDAMKASAEDEEDKDDEEDDSVFKSRGGDDDEVDSDKEEEEVQAEIEAMKQRRLREKKRQKKKERAAAAKRRRRAALGMDLNAIDIPEHDKTFSLASIKSKRALEAAAEVNLDEIDDEELGVDDGGSDEDIYFGDGDDRDDEDHDDSPIHDADDEEERLRHRERELDAAYDLYLQTTNNRTVTKGTNASKLSKKAQRQKLASEAEEDQEMVLMGTAGMSYNMKTYVKMLSGAGDDEDAVEEDDSSASDDEDDGFDKDPMSPEEHAAMMSSKRRKVSEEDVNPLIHKFAEATSTKTARWFSNPLFAEIGKAAHAASMAVKSAEYEDSDNADETSEGDEGDTDNDGSTKKNRAGLDADDVIALMPKTDKQVRHERRLKKMARDERKKTRAAKRLGEQEGDFELVPASVDKKAQADDELGAMSENQRQKVLKARELIKAGMGALLEKESNGISKIEIVSDDRPLPVRDERKYDSENEDYDSDDYAKTLALGTMMLRRSKERALVDASYNRYAWNDPVDLPEWFLDDEKRHYKPQLPIPPALMAKMKEKMMALSAKPIKKVAEARARKQKRAKAKLAAAKKQADALANSADLSEAMKLRAISKALRGKELKKPGKTYVVAKKGRNVKAGKNVITVDKRMKKEKRALKRIEKKKKH